jgi:hypothetical protein
MVARALSITKYIIRTIQKIFLGLFLSTLFPIDLIDVIKYLTSILDTNIDERLLPELETASEDSTEEAQSEETNHYLLMLIPITTILIVIVGGVTDLHMDNLFLTETIAELLTIAEEQVYKSEVTASNLYG